MTDREDSSMPEKTLRKRKETKHPGLSRSRMCKCVSVCAGYMPLRSLGVPERLIFCACPITNSCVRSVTAERVMGTLECDAIQRLFI